MEAQVAAVPSPAAKFNPWRSLIAVVVGVVVDLGGTNIVGLCFAVVVMLPLLPALAAQNLPPAEMQAQLQAQLNAAVSGSAIMFVLGGLLSLIGGYVTGRIARHAEALHGLAVGLGVTLVSLTLTFALGLPAGASPFWRLALGVALNWGIPALGGYLAQLQRMRASRRLTSHT